MTCQHGRLAFEPPASSPAMTIAMDQLEEAKSWVAA
jgi:hypothetical protein